MASIEKRLANSGETTYRVKVRLKGFPTQSATFSRLTDARKWAENTQSAIREGRHFKTVEAKRHTVSELIDRYCHDVLPSKKSGKDQKRHLVWWNDAIGTYLLADVTPALIVEHRDKLKSGITVRGSQRSPSTVNRYMAALSHVFTVAMKEWGWVEDTPFRRVSTLKEPRGRVRFLTDEERGALLKACKGHSKQLYTIVVLALSTGARQMEILSLTWPQVDLSQGTILLEETKNGERRVLPLAGHAFELVKSLSKVRRIDSDLLFPSRRKADRPVSVQSIFNRVVESTGIEDFRFHDLRHSAASYLAMNGASLNEIAEVLGHKTLQMVKRYAHLSEAHTASVVASMNLKIFGA